MRGREVSGGGGQGVLLGVRGGLGHGHGHGGGSDSVYSMRRGQVLDGIKRSGLYGLCRMSGRLTVTAFGSPLFCWDQYWLVAISESEYGEPA